MDTISQSISDLNSLGKFWSHVGYSLWIGGGTLGIGPAYILLASCFPALQIKDKRKEQRIRRVFGKYLGRAIFDEGSVERRIIVILAVVILIGEIFSPVTFIIGDHYTSAAQQLDSQQQASQIDAMRKQLAPPKWSISDAQFKKFQDSIDRKIPPDPFGDMGRVDVCYFGGDDDGKKVARSLWLSMLYTDWGAQHVEMHIADDAPPAPDAGKYPCTDEGILILVTSACLETGPNVPTGNLARIERAFGDSGIPYKIVGIDGFALGQVIVRVGKPPRNPPDQ